MPACLLGIIKWTWPFDISVLDDKFVVLPIVKVFDLGEAFAVLIVERTSTWYAPFFEFKFNVVWDALSMVAVLPVAEENSNIWPAVNSYPVTLSIGGFEGLSIVLTTTVYNSFAVEAGKVPVPIKEPEAVDTVVVPATGTETDWNVLYM